MKTRTEQLADAIEKIYQANKADIDTLPNHGPNGGRNAATISGWTNYGNGTITRAANMTNMPVMSYWSGSAPTPSSALPEMCYKEITKAYNKIFV
jgi:hypothetical protein